MKILALIGAWFEAFRNKLDLPFRRFEMASTSSATSLTIDVPEINELPSNSDSKEEDVITAFKLEMKELKEAMMIELESIEIGGKVRISKQLVALGFCLPALVMFGLAIKEAEQEADKLEIGAKMLSTCALDFDPYEKNPGTVHSALFMLYDKKNKTPDGSMSNLMDFILREVNHLHIEDKCLVGLVEVKLG
ncbi:hypothetical protein ZIOFF_061802 [Zingiber officinale]|uniref:Uncharacterized protein n=1 Tax=Zingiber officinale TaxID=94328 RepID=A0A8J5K8Q6_ZINOF|nr:hypothetical protein ZIOFF_061802 [Zingiber officinale]